MYLLFSPIQIFPLSLCLSSFCCRLTDMSNPSSFFFASPFVSNSMTHSYHNWHVMPLRTILWKTQSTEDFRCVIMQSAPPDNAVTYKLVVVGEGKSSSINDQSILIVFFISKVVWVNLLWRFKYVGRTTTIGEDDVCFYFSVLSKDVCGGLRSDDWR